MKKMLLALGFLFLHCENSIGQQTGDSIALSKIRAASLSNSSISGSITAMSDIQGPRLLGTSAYFKSAQWASRQLKKFGADTTFFESFDNKHRGWVVKSFNAEMISPAFMHIAAYPLAYTQSTKGTVEAPVVYLAHNDSIFNLKGRLRGKVVLLGQEFTSFNSSQQILSGRISDDLLKQAASNQDPNDLLIGYHARRSTNEAISSQEQRRQKQLAFFTFCAKEGVVALMESSDYPYGILHIDGNRHLPSYTREGDLKPIASFVIANEHFGRMVRLIKSGIIPRIRVNLQSQFNYNPEFNVNVVADLNGTDPSKSGEQVIIGAHLDSWHGGTGASDNAAGSAVMMEAIRILKSSDLKTKRTIRIVLWGGEEQIFAGSRSYVNKHAGNLQDGTHAKDYSKISAYFNLDNGTGKIRGINTQGNDKVIPLFEQYLTPFVSAGSGTVTLQNVNQTDHELFDALNIPAFQFIQDPLNYISAVHHTNMDVAEYVNQKDLQENAVIVAWLIYKVAMQEDLLPRRDFISIKPDRTGSTAIFLKGFERAKSVSVISDFNNWSMFGTPLEKIAGGWICNLDLKNGIYLYKFIVDGDWVADPATALDKLVKDNIGHAGLTELIVK